MRAEPSKLAHLAIRLLYTNWTMSLDYYVDGLQSVRRGIWATGDAFRCVSGPCAEAESRVGAWEAWISYRNWSWS